MWFPSTKQPDSTIKWHHSWVQTISSCFSCHLSICKSFQQPVSNVLSSRRYADEHLLTELQDPRSDDEVDLTSAGMCCILIWHYWGRLIYFSSTAGMKVSHNVLEWCGSFPQMKNIQTTLNYCLNTLSKSTIHPRNSLQTNIKLCLKLQ